MSAFFQQILAFTRRNLVLVVSLVIIVLMGPTFYFLWQRQQALTSEHAEIQRSGEEILQALAGQARLTAEIAAVKEAVDFIERNLVNEGDLAENLGYFYQIETASRIRFSQLNQLSSQPQPSGNYFKSVPFTLQASGTYRQIIRLLHELETGPRLLKIDNYALRQSVAGPEAARAGTGRSEPPLPGGDGADLVSLEITVELLGRP